jgi:hypothetical protein
MNTTAKSPLFIAAVALAADQILVRFYVSLDPHVHWLLLNGGASLMAIVLMGEALECTQSVVLCFERCALSAIASWSRVRNALRRSRN